MEESKMRKERIKSVAIVGLVMVIILLSCAVIKSNQEKDYYKTVVEENGIEAEQIRESFMCGSIVRSLDVMHNGGYVSEEAYEQLIKLEEELIENPSYSKLKILENFAIEQMQHVNEEFFEE